MMKKIMIVSPCDLPVPAVQGGAVQTLIDSITIPNEEEQTFNITVVSSYNEEAYRLSQMYTYTQFCFLKRSKVPNFIDSVVNFAFGLIDSTRKLRKCNFLWKSTVIKKCQRLLKEEKYDAVILENQGYLTKIFDSGMLLEDYKGKIYYHLHNDIPNSVSRRTINECKCILISDYLSKKILDDYGTHMRSNLLILHNGIPVEKYLHRISSEERNKLKSKLGFQENDKIVCFVGRINPAKGILELLQAMKKINDEQIKLLVIGATEFGNNATSEFEEKIKQICESLGKRVCSTGYVPHEDIWKYYQIADLAALPSVWEEPAGLTILEAMTSQLPVITTNAGGIPEFMRPEYGFMLERDEFLIDNIAKSILEICENMDIWREKGKLAQQYVVSNYSEDAYFHSFINLICRDSQK